MENWWWLVWLFDGCGYFSFLERQNEGSDSVVGWDGFHGTGL